MTDVKNPDAGLLGVAAELGIGVSGAEEKVDSLLGKKLAESARPRLWERLPPSGTLLRTNSNRGEVVCVGVGGVLTMTGGVPLSEAAGGVPGGVLVTTSRDFVLARDRPLTRSVGPRLCSCVPSIPSFEPSLACGSGCGLGRSGTGGWVISGPS